MNEAQHKTANLLKTFFFCSSVYVSVYLFNGWPKTTLLLPVWSRDDKRLDTHVGRFIFFTLKLGVKFPLKEYKTPSHWLGDAALTQPSSCQET